MAKHRSMIGGKWDELGDLQFRFLVERGLRPEHYFLDVGCGPGRGASKIVPYLDSGRYLGVDKDETLLRGFRLELGPLMELKDVRIEREEEFEIPAEDGTFDFALAFSVFTHLGPVMVRKCIEGVMPKMKPGGEFYATFWHGREVGVGDLKPGETRFYQRCHYPFTWFSDCVRNLRTTCYATLVGGFSHPRGQQMLLIKRGRK